MRGVNPYYGSSEIGLSVVATLDEDLNYDFNTLMVWKHDASGRVFTAQDSGCSCPTPFEDYHFRGPDNTNLYEVTIGDSLTSLIREIDAFPAPQSDRETAISRVQSSLRGKK